MMKPADEMNGDVTEMHMRHSLRILVMEDVGEHEGLYPQNHPRLRNQNDWSTTTANLPEFSTQIFGAGSINMGQPLPHNLQDCRRVGIIIFEQMVIGTTRSAKHWATRFFRHVSSLVCDAV